MISTINDNLREVTKNQTRISALRKKIIYMTSVSSPSPHNTAEWLSRALGTSPRVLIRAHSNRSEKSEINGQSNLPQLFDQVSQSTGLINKKKKKRNISVEIKHTLTRVENMDVVKILRLIGTTKEQMMS
jgi:hypothetical protein